MQSRSDAELIKQTFRKTDRDGSGGLSKQEFVNLLHKVGMKRESALAIFRCVDGNDDRRIDFDEFVDWLCSNSQKLPTAQVTPDRDAADRVMRYATNRPKDTGPPTPFDNLKRRYPNRSDAELREALRAANGHGGNAATLLEGREAADVKACQPVIAHIGETIGACGANNLRHFCGI
mmetsp:Transcript_75843/g.148864  ORF Transcript_75843/g.148864 Transcript_75843/m.148864 type:complete len:177 (+) Transcript_75843:93-623(+)